MRIEVVHQNGKVLIAAVDDTDEFNRRDVVARAEGTTVVEASKALVSRFAELQKQTLEALHASGLIRYVPTDTESLS